jgi:(2R)-sulfolactate sulfo-lyase subunit beta
MLGKRTKFIDALQPAEAPNRGPGMYVHGHQLRGRRSGDPLGRQRRRDPLVPNRAGQRHRQPDRAGHQDQAATPKTVATMAEHIDHDVSAILRGEKTLDQAGDELIDIIVRTANGRLTAAEAWATASS